MLTALTSNFGSNAAKKLGIGLLFVALVFAPMASTAQNTSAQNVAPSTLTGKHVTLRIGPGFSPSAASSIARVLNNKGCPATLHDDGLFDNAIEVEIDDAWETFESVGSAGHYALTLCKR